MRDVNRIDIFLEKLKELWLKYPNLRFWQIICLIMNYLDIDPFYFEEDKWIKVLNSIIEEAE